MSGNDAASYIMESKCARKMRVNGVSGEVGMKRTMFEGRFYATYFYAGSIRNVLYDQFSYLSRLSDFYGDGQYLELIAPFQKRSALHAFIEFVVDDLLAQDCEGLNLKSMQAMENGFKDIPEALADLEPAELPIEAELKYYDIEHQSFVDWLRSQGKSFAEASEDDVGDYYSEIRLGVEYEQLLDRSVGEVFFILFQNRDLLLLFNDMIANHVKETEVDGLEPEYRKYFAESGKLKRVAIPAWVRRAVFFRERGLCALCQTDLTGTLSVGDAEHYDHIVPLAKGGLNDVTNVQVLCAACNGKKHSSAARTSGRYEAWYPIAGDA
jgi:5-methylcytosine-specific restriction endonuclease McrA